MHKRPYFVEWPKSLQVDPSYPSMINGGYLQRLRLPTTHTWNCWIWFCFWIPDFTKNISPCGCYLWQRECCHPIAIKRQHQGSDPFSSARCRERRVIDGTHLWSHPHGNDEKVRMQWFKHITPRGFAWNLVPMPIWQLQVSQASWARNVTKAHIRMVLGLEWSWSFPKGTGF